MTTLPPSLFERLDVEFFSRGRSGTLVRVPGARDLIWVPSYAIHDLPGRPKGSLVVERWFAEKAGWIK